MLSFDKPFDNEISRKSEDGYTAIILRGVGYLQNRSIDIEKSGVEKLRIFEQDGDTYIIFISKDSLSVQASKSENGYGLRLRATQMQNSATQANKNTTQAKQGANSTPIPFQGQQGEQQNEPQPLSEVLANDEIDYTNYISVLGVLGALVVVLLIVKRRVVSSKSSSSWLFSKGSIEESISIISQKNLDVKNRVVLLESYGVRYLVIIGQNGVIVLDKYSKNDRKTQKREIFEELLENNKEMLDSFLELDNKKLEDFKKKASRDYY